MQNYSLNQAYTFIIFIILGIFIGVIFDFFRILRKSIKTKDIITYFQDITFWSIVCILLLYFIYRFNNGEIRFFIFIGIIIGNAFYLLTISKKFININLTIFNFFKKIFEKIIFKPLKNIIHFFVKLCKKIIKIIKKSIIDKVFEKNSLKKKDFKV